MIIILLIGFIFCIIISPFLRMLLKNMHLVGVYSIIDLVEYIKYKRWSEWDLFGIDMYVGMFGTGKTLSMTHRVREIYNTFGNRLRYISNYDLKDIPYIPLTNFNQLIDLGDDNDIKYEGTVVLIAKISVR